jgi:hypothetical protein
MTRLFLPLFAVTLGFSTGTALADVPVDLSGFQAERGIAMRHEKEALFIEWPAGLGEVGRLVLDLKPGAPLIQSLGLAKVERGPAVEVIRDADFATSLTVGTRVGEPNRPPGMSPFNAFFDSPGKRPNQTYQAKLDLKRVQVTGKAGRATIALGVLSAGPFAGELCVTVYSGSRLVHVEAVVRTDEPDRAFFYDAGIISTSPSWRSLAWTDVEGQPGREEVATTSYRQIMVRHRAIAAEVEGGSLACMPPPHQFFFPRDYTHNLATAWLGRGASPSGFGVRQAANGGGNFSPWFNAPPGSLQRLGVFYVLARGTAEHALDEAMLYTRGDRFPDLAGYRTFTSHWHMAITAAAMQAKDKGQISDFVKMFKDMNVKIVHLAEFHGDGHPGDPGPLRLPEMAAMFAECKRLSDESLLFLPGEEANVYLGPSDKRPAGHWLYLFPRPVMWTMKRSPDQPFREAIPGRSYIYHVGNREEMARLIELEHGLAWTAHPRIKASTWAPDCYRDQPFYKADSWLGAAWKAMPADLSRPRLGERSLDLLDDMANWGGHKYMLGEVDVFKLDHTDELYGHMNVNYLRLDRIPEFDGDWTPILDALRLGQFFVTTGEVLLRSFNVGGKSSGETLSTASNATPEIKIELEWTFPLRFAEVVSGDGTKVYRTEIDLTDTPPFGRRTITLKPDLRGRRWVRVAAWDVAGNGAFSQPVWLNPEPLPR